MGHEYKACVEQIKQWIGVTNNAHRRKAPWLKKIKFIVGAMDSKLDLLSCSNFKRKIAKLQLFQLDYVEGFLLLHFEGGI